VLWDIDGTLLQRASGEHAAALRQAIEESPRHLDRRPARRGGRPDGRGDRPGPARRRGSRGGAIDERAAEVREATCRAFAELCPPDMSHKVAAGRAEALGVLGDRHRQALLTALRARGAVEARPGGSAGTSPAARGVRLGRRGARGAPARRAAPRGRVAAGADGDHRRHAAGHRLRPGGRRPRRGGRDRPVRARRPARGRSRRVRRPGRPGIVRALA
jgi:hypothetical protein